MKSAGSVCAGEEVLDRAMACSGEDKDFRICASSLQGFWEIEGFVVKPSAVRQFYR